MYPDHQNRLSFLTKKAHKAASERSLNMKNFIHPTKTVHSFILVLMVFLRTKIGVPQMVARF